jgi:preprotein translocase subunit SecF
MIDLFTNPNYNFVGRRRWAYAASATVMLIALVSLLVQGLRYNVDFTGGTLIQVRFTTPMVRTAQVASSTGEIAKRVEAALRSQPSLGTFEIRRVEFVGPQVGRDLQMQAVYAVIAAVVGILIYLRLRFDLKGGVTAVVAILHDVIVCLGALSLTHRDFSFPGLAALLTIVGYSVNDTIVAYDRLRENRSKTGSVHRPLVGQMNDAINQTLGDPQLGRPHCLALPRHQIRRSRRRGIRDRRHGELPPARRRWGSRSRALSS